VEHATSLLNGALPLGHNFSIWIVNPANASQEIEVCSRCNAHSGNIRAITPVCPHDFNTLGTLISAANCSTPAKHRAKCSLCGMEHATLLLDGAAALGHNFSILGTPISAATCTTPAKHKAKCSICGVEHATLLLDGVAVLAHDFSAFGTQVSAATCSTPAKYRAKCSLCGTEHTTLFLNGTSTLGHNFNTLGTLVNAATCTTPVQYRAKCSLCGEEHTTLLINGAAALGHNFSVWIQNPLHPNKEIEVCSICGDPSGISRTIVPGSIVINAINFPDAKFREWALAQPWGSDTYLTAEEIASIKHINVTYQGIQNLTGIGYFTNLTSLYCSDNLLTSLDVSGLEKLEKLYCEDNKLTSLNVSALTNLQELNCSRNRLTSLDVSNSINLNRLFCSYQSPTLTFTATGNVYSAAIALNSPTRLAAGVTYTAGTLASISDAIGASDFSVAVAGFAARLEGVFSFAYIGELLQVGIDDNTVQFNVYPNPTTDKVFLSAPANVKLFNQQGTLLQSSYGNEIDLSAYPQGLYILQIHGGRVVKVVRR